MNSTLRSSKPKVTLGLALAALVLFFARHDLWFRDTTSLFAGLPASLLYHLAYCVLVSVVLAIFLFRKPSA